MESIPERVTKFIGDGGVPVCDDCIAAFLKLSRRQQAHRVTSALAVTPLYHRYQGECTHCGREKLVIEHA
jgi:hypothetical protein